MKIQWKQTLSALVIGLVLGIATGGFATWNAFHGPRTERMLKRLEHRLDLTPEQRAQIQAVFESQKPRFQAIREETHAEIAKILTPEQKAKFDQMKR